MSSLGMIWGCRRLSGDCKRVKRLPRGRSARQCVNRKSPAQMKGAYKESEEFSPLTTIVKFGGFALLSGFTVKYASALVLSGLFQVLM